MLSPPARGVSTGKPGRLVDHDRLAVDEQDEVFEGHWRFHDGHERGLRPLMHALQRFTRIYEALRTINLLRSEIAWLMDA